MTERSPLRPSGDVITWIYTDRLDECRRFWGELLGCPVEVTWDDDSGRGTMWRVSANALIEIKEAPAPVPQANFNFAIETDAVGDVDAWFEAMRAADVPVLQAPADQHYGHRNAAVRDPAGVTVICFARLDR